MQRDGVILDLSHPLEPAMPSYPGLPEPKFHVYMAHGDAQRQAKYAPGTSFQIATYELGGNTGTYVDAPFHRYPAGLDLAGVPLERLANLPGVVVDAPEEGAVGLTQVRDLDVSGKAVLFRTRWSARWGGSDYFRSGPFLNAAAATHLASRGPALVGIDCANIDDMTDPVRPAHTHLLAAGIPIVEHLCNLEALRGAFRLFAVPPAIRGGTSFPIRAFAITG